MGHARGQRRRLPGAGVRRPGSRGRGLGSHVHLLLAAGFCGALSTWSTFSYELLTLTSARRLAVAAGYLVLSVGGGVGLSFAGAAVADVVF